MRLRIHVACPASAGRTGGNRVTARRWARLFRELGHAARVADGLVGSPDLLVALHAKKSAAAVRAFAARWPERPIAVALTGTDLYGDLPRGDRTAAASLEAADRLVVLHAGAGAALPRRLRAKVRPIHQSVPVSDALARAARSAGARSRHFDALVLAHLRREKDPLRAALAVRDAPAGSRLRVVHLGRALDPRLAERARAEERRNPRYRWLGERPRSAALRRLAAARLLVVSSRLEGGANATGEAAVLGVGVLATRIDGNTGLLGERHPGLFPVGDTRALSALLLRAERDPGFLAELRAASRAAAPLFEPRREREAWRALLLELFPGA